MFLSGKGVSWRHLVDRGFYANFDLAFHLLDLNIVVVSSNCISMFVFPRTAYPCLLRRELNVLATVAATTAEAEGESVEISLCLSALLVEWLARRTPTPLLANRSRLFESRHNTCADGGLTAVEALLTLA